MSLLDSCSRVPRQVAGAAAVAATVTAAGVQEWWRLRSRWRRFLATHMPRMMAGMRSVMRRHGTSFTTTLYTSSVICNTTKDSTLLLNHTSLQQQQQQQQQQQHHQDHKQSYTPRGSLNAIRSEGGLSYTHVKYFPLLSGSYDGQPPSSGTSVLTTSCQVAKHGACVKNR